MKPRKYPDVKAELDQYRQDIEADIDRVKNLFDPTRLRQQATELAAAVWRNPRRRWLVLGLAGGLLLWLVLGRRRSGQVELTEGSAGTRVVVHENRPPSLWHDLLREMMRYVLLTLAQRLLRQLLEQRKAGEAQRG
ncbi:MAG: hypothetical protein SFY70_03280 [Bacteroidia bacterium]|nr:hypothetical protein [Bacteroidia bacterium]